MLVVAELVQESSVFFAPGSLVCDYLSHLIFFLGLDFWFEFSEIKAQVQTCFHSSMGLVYVCFGDYSLRHLLKLHFASLFANCFFAPSSLV